jgi:tRNA(Ile)-lysidine synthase
MANSRTQQSADHLRKRLTGLVERQISLHARRGEAVTVGLSGGVDSIVLLDLVRAASAQLALVVQCLHVNHGLSPNADNWESFCREHCRRLGVRFQAVRVQVAGGGANVEAQARAARYRAFRDHGSSIVALAHNRDDQAETVLLRLLRGAGVSGLAGMPSARSLEDAQGASAQRLVRPLLQVSRAEIQAYALDRELCWIDDESNAEERFARNFLRLRVIPQLETRYPAARANLARAAGHLAEAAMLLGEIAREDLRSVGREGAILVDSLAALGQARAANVLRLFLAQHGEPPPSTAVALEALRQLTAARADAQPEVRLGSTVLRRYRGTLTAHPAEDVENGWEPVAWRGEEAVWLPHGGVLRALASLGEGVSAIRLQHKAVTIRLRRGGERVRLSGAGRTRTLKNLLQEAGIPPWQRKQMPLVYCDAQLVWVPGVGVASEFRAAPGELAWRFAWEPQSVCD